MTGSSPAAFRTAGRLPSGSHRPATLLAAFALAGLAPAFFFLPMEIRRTAPEELYPLGHLVAFFLAALLLLRVPRLRRAPVRERALLVFSPLLLASAAIEYLQPAFGRSSNVLDLAPNLAAVLLAFAFGLPAGDGGRAVRLLAVLCVLGSYAHPLANLGDRLVAALHFPVLADFDTPGSSLRYRRGQRSDAFARDGTHALRLELEPDPSSGTSHFRSLGDWRGFDRLELSVLVEDDESLLFFVSIRDVTHDLGSGARTDRYERPFRLGPGWNDLSIPLAEVRDAPAGRRFDLARPSTIVFFVYGLDRRRVLYLDRLLLVREPAGVEVNG